MVAAVDPAVSVRYSYAPEASDSPVAHNVRKDRGLGLANPVSPLAVARGELNGAFALHRPEGGGGSPFSSLHCRPPSSSPRERENEQPFEDQPLKKSAEHYRAALGTRQRRSGGSPLPHQPWEAGDAPSAPPHPQEAYGMWGRSPSPPPPAMPEADEMYPRVQGVDRREHRQPPPRAQGGGQGGGHRHQPRPVRMGRAKGWRMFAAYEVFKPRPPTKELLSPRPLPLASPPSPALSPSLSWPRTLTRISPPISA